MSPAKVCVCPQIYTPCTRQGCKHESNYIPNASWRICIGAFPRPPDRATASYHHHCGSHVCLKVHLIRWKGPCCDNPYPCIHICTYIHVHTYLHTFKGVHTYMYILICSFRVTCCLQGSQRSWLSKDHYLVHVVSTLGTQARRDLSSLDRWEKHPSWICTCFSHSNVLAALPVVAKQV